MQSRTICATSASLLDAPVGRVGDVRYARHPVEPHVVAPRGACEPPQGTTAQPDGVLEFLFHCGNRLARALDQEAHLRIPTLELL
jgi:hypothetical protein